VGGEQRGYDGGKKIRGRKRHLLVDTEGLVMKAKVHSAKVAEQDGLRLLLECARMEISSIKHLWLDAGYQGRGKRWAEEVIGLSVEVVRKSIPKARLGEGGEALGRGVGQGRREGRLAKAHATARLSGVAEEVGSREDLPSRGWDRIDG